MTPQTCQADWTGLGIGAPDEEDGPCAGQLHEVVQACVHEHVSRGRVCDRHLAVMAGYLPFGQWWCSRCVLAGFRVLAPLRVLD